MNITLNLLPRMGYGGDSQELQDFLAEAYDSLYEGNPCPDFSLEWMELESIPARWQRAAQKMWAGASAEIQALLKATLALRDLGLSTTSDVTGTWVLELVLQAAQFSNLWSETEWLYECFPDFKGFPFWMDKNRGTTYDAFHQLPGHPELIYLVTLDGEELAGLKRASPLSQLETQDWIAQSLSFMGMKVADLSRKTWLEKVLPSYLKKAALALEQGVPADILARPGSLQGDTLGLH